MTLETLNYKTVAHWYKRQPADTLDAWEVGKVERNLNALWRVYVPKLGEITFQSKTDVANPYPRFSGQFTCYMDEEERNVHGVNGVTYWRYKALSTIISQNLLWEGYHWKGRKKTWEQMNGILSATAASPLTLQFVRSDILYRSAVDEYNRCNDKSIANTKLVLSQYGTYQV